MSKRINIKVAGSEREPIDFLISAGVTAGQVLKQLKIPNYILSTLPTADQPIFNFNAEDEVYPELLDGHLLWAIPPNLSRDALINLCIYGSFEPP